MSGSYRRIDSTVKMKAIGQKKGGGWEREEDQRQNLGFFQCGVGGRGANKDWEGVVRKAGRGSEDYRVPETKETTLLWVPSNGPGDKLGRRTTDSIRLP